VPVYDFGEWQGYLFIVMALITGGTLKERIQGPLPVEAAVRLVGQVADALGYAHGQGIYHRDVKPTNVLLAAGDWPMLSDFGIARALGETTRLTSPHGTIGTPAYMAPEQWLGGEIDGRADLYSLGIVLYELLAGTPPFTATTPQGLMRQHLEMPIPPLASRRPDLPAAFEDVLQTALAKAPDQRYRHAGEFKAALEAALRQPQSSNSFSHTALASSDGAMTTSPDLGRTMRVADQLRAAEVAPPRQTGRIPPAVLVAVVALVVLLAGTVGYIAASSRFGSPGSPSPTSATETSASAPVSTPAPPPTALPQPVPTATPLVVVVTATPLPPSPTTPPTATTPPVGATEPTTVAPPIATAPPPTVRPPANQPTALAKSPPIAPAPTDLRFALVERHVSDYFAALNADDYARAQAVCCTPGWRAQNPLDEWRKNFTGVTDLRITSPFRYTAVEPNRIVAEVDYSFVNSSGARQFFTLRWTFVPVGSDWLANEATAFRQR
jgi:serine/threonine protein kinase